jgi:hypothetical protein
MYLLFVIVKKKTRKETYFFIGILNASEEKRRIPIRNPEVRILIKGYGSGTLLVGLYGKFGVNLRALFTQSVVWKE